MSVAANGRHQNADMVVIGYCVHCRTRRQMNDAIEVCNRRGGRDLKGLCSICGKSIYRLGGWNSVVTANEAARREADTQESVPQEAVQQASVKVL